MMNGSAIPTAASVLAVGSPLLLDDAEEALDSAGRLVTMNDLHSHHHLTGVICDANVVVPLSASRLRLLQDTTMIESALDLDSLEESSVGTGSQAGLLKLNVV